VEQLKATDGEMEMCGCTCNRRETMLIAGQRQKQFNPHLHGMVNGNYQRYDVEIGQATKIEIIQGNRG